MIVRISNEGQYELDDAHLARLNELDNQAVAACDGQDEQHFRATFDELLAFVRQQGRVVPDEDLAPSDVILPPPDVSLAEARTEFSGEGLIPG